MTAAIIRADARRLPLPDESVDLIVTSPPYWGLRSYTDGGRHYDGQIGAESTPQEYIAALLECTREWTRVLKPEGSLWVNVGDKYAGAPSGPRRTGPGAGRDHSAVWEERRPRPIVHVRSKSLLGLPWRYALGCIDDLGLILRAEVVWSKCISGGAQVYARVNGREKVIMVKDLARCVPGSVELWTGERWSAMLRCEPTPPTAGRTSSSQAARSARYRGKPIPPLAADLEIEFRNGERVGCTPNHKWPTQRGQVRADELTVGDIVPVARLAEGKATPRGLDDEMTGWLVGLFIAEGSRSEETVQIASHVRETERFARLGEIAEAFDGRFSLQYTRGNAASANLTGKVIRAIIDAYVGGRTSADKRLAPACWRRSDAFLRALLDGYLSGDGHYESKTDRWKLGFTRNDGLATDLRALAARLGYSLRLRRAQHRFDTRTFAGWRGTLYLDPARRKRPDGEVIAIRQSRARQFWNIEIADEPNRFALASGLLTCNSNGLPESVTDRVRRSHEQFFHFTKQGRYYAAVDEIREPQTMRPQRRPNGHKQRQKQGVLPAQTYSTSQRDEKGVDGHPLGALPGSVWELPTQPLRVPRGLEVDHFAAFPPALIRRIILGWSPVAICTECREGRRPATVTRPVTTNEWAMAQKEGRNWKPDGEEPKRALGAPAAERDRRITGYVCACPAPDAPTCPAVVLDPFGGTGTTAVVADVHGRHGISADLSHDYCRLARWRTTDPAERARALGVPKPPPVPDGQDSLFEEIA